MDGLNAVLAWGNAGQPEALCGKSDALIFSDARAAAHPNLLG
jgi:hypothetical protein